MERDQECLFPYQAVQAPILPGNTVQENNIPVKWPVSEYELRRQFPKKSLPEKISEKCAKELGYGLFVFNGYPSDFDATYQNIEEVTPVLINGKYNQSYKITEKYSPEEKKKF